MQLSFQQTYKFALNSSSSKSQHRFPKAARFLDPKRKDQKAKLYTLPSSISYQHQRAPSFPKLVKKMQFPEQYSKKMIPSPSTYSIKSDIERSLSERRGVSMPKQKISNKVYTKTPGPGNYNPIKQPYLTARYSIGSSKKKLEFPLELQKGKYSPGPAYLVNVDKLQKVVSKYVNKKQPSLKKSPNKSIFNPQARLLLQSISKKPSEQTKSILFDSKQKTKHPTPNFSKFIQNNKHQSLIMKNQASVMGKFNKAERRTVFETKSSTPGPGYNWFSQFSRLQKKVYQQKVKGEKPNKKNSIK